MGSAGDVGRTALNVLGERDAVERDMCDLEPDAYDAGAMLSPIRELFRPTRATLSASPTRTTRALC